MIYGRFIKNKIIGLEKRLFQADIRNSADELDKLVADQFIEFGSSDNSYNKEQIKNSLGSESDLQITATDFDLKQLSSDVVFVTYRATMTYKGFGKERYSLRSSIWRFIDDRWQMIFHQGTPTSAA
ncbi:MAG: DUF4440 domain-containing protein [Candidatus Zixiibacteriota bacterium]|nr:MAG: DUF4440 domain-containing protein [candidate division Zixibacteria bacterium]